MATTTTTTTTITVMNPHVTTAAALNAIGRVNRDYPGGLYNTTCGPFSPECLSEFNLVCVDERCTCIHNYKPIDDGGCVEDTEEVVKTWTVRLIIIAIVVFCFLLLLQNIIERRRRCCGGAGEQESRRVVDEEQGTSCWYDSPPPNYQEVTDSDTPPPSYQDALTKILEVGSVPTEHLGGRTLLLSPSLLPSPVRGNKEGSSRILHFLPYPALYASNTTASTPSGSSLNTTSPTADTTCSVSTIVPAAVAATSSLTTTVLAADATCSLTSTVPSAYAAGSLTTTVLVTDTTRSLTTTVSTANTDSPSITITPAAYTSTSVTNTNLLSEAIISTP